MMEQIAAAEIERAVRERGIKAWKLRSCSMCGAPLHYVFSGDGDVFYDPNCGCVRYWTPREPRSFDSLAETFNMQTPEVRARWWADFLSQGRDPEVAPLKDRNT